MTDENLKTVEPVEKPVIRAWTAQRFSKKLNLATVMAATARSEFMELLGRRGIDEAFIARVEELVRIVIELNNRQEVLKGELRRITEEIDTNMKEMTQKYTEIKKIIKIAIPRAEWKKFGFDDFR